MKIQVPYQLSLFSLNLLIKIRYLIKHNKYYQLYLLSKIYFIMSKLLDK